MREIVNSSDFVSMQYNSFERFFSRTNPLPEFSFQRIFQGYQQMVASQKPPLSITDWNIADNAEGSEECRLLNGTYHKEIELSTNDTDWKWPLRIHIPCPTSSSEFILASKNGRTANRYAMIIQLVQSPGVHYREWATNGKAQRTCTLVPVIGKKQRIIERNGFKHDNGTSIFLGKNKVSKDYSYIKPLYMSRLGKKQMAAELTRKCAIDQKNVQLTEKEFHKIHQLFQQRKLSVTDDRSLRNLKAKLIGDFLYEIFSDAFSPQTDWEHEPYVIAETLQRRIDGFFRQCELFQLLDDANPLAEISQKRRVTFFGPGGLPDDIPFLEKRDVHPTDFGRLCPVESPQGKKLGLNLYLAHTARISPLGLIEARYVDRKTKHDVFLDPFDELKNVQAVRSNGDTPIEKDTFWIKKPNEEVDFGKDDMITHETPNPCSFLGYAASLIPFIQHNDGNRALMGANMMKQTLLLKTPSPPLIRTGFESFIATGYQRDCKPDNPCILHGELCLGANLLVGYMPWDLLNYEDAIVISEKLVREEILTHGETEEIIVDEKGYSGERIDINTIIQPGEKVTPQRRLVRKTRPGGTPSSKEPAALELSLILHEKEQTQNKQDASLYAPKDIDGVVSEVQVVSSNLPDDVTLRVRIIIQREYPIKVGDKLTGRHGNKGIVSAILAEKDMPYFKSPVNQCGDDKCQIKENHTHLEILLNPLSVTGRMNLGQLYETTLGWMAKHTCNQQGLIVSPFNRDWTWERILRTLKENGLSHRQQLYIWEEGKEQDIGKESGSSNLVTVGYQYFVKLHHLAAKKITARSQDEPHYSAATGQPTVPLLPPSSPENIWQNRRERRKKAQRLGEMEVWALEGHSAWNIINELLFLKSDAEKDRSHLVDYLRNPGIGIGTLADPQREHRALKALVYYLRALGFELEGRDTEGAVVQLVGPGAPASWPLLVAMSLRTATDAERKQWAENRLVTSGGTEVDGLWSAKFGDLNSSDPTAVHQAQEACGCIELPFPVEGMNALLIVPKSLRYEDEDFTNLKNPGYENDLNYLYRAIIQCVGEINKLNPIQRVRSQKADRLKHFIHALLFNDKKKTDLGSPLCRPGSNKPLRSIMASIVGYARGKDGIFRKHLLGKRVNLSGRAVITPDPDLGLDEAGIPYRMGKVLYRDALMRKYLESYVEAGELAGKNLELHLGAARKFLADVENLRIIREWLGELSANYPVLLNRAPTLHRLNILAFYPRFHDEGDVIRLNPYVCKAFNADFDGDSIGVHVPLLPGSTKESFRMLPSSVLFSATNGEIILSHKADLALGCYLLTRSATGRKEFAEILGYDPKRLEGPVHAEELRFILEDCATTSAKDDPTPFTDRLMGLTNKIRPLLSHSGLSLGLDDFLVKDAVLNQAKKLRATVAETSLDAQKGHKKSWEEEIAGIKKHLGADALVETSSLRIFFKSKSAKGDLMQLVGMRGFQARPGGGQTPQPILSNIFEGMTPLEYFSAAHGSRHGMTDKGLTTAITGDLMNILIQAVQDTFIIEDNCGTRKGLYVSAFQDPNGGSLTLESRITGRFLAQRITVGGTSVNAGTLITPELAEMIAKVHTWLKIRSSIFCECKDGICQKCYGLDLSTHDVPDRGFPAGVVAAQSIGEPGTQLVLRTFHTGGAAGQGIGEGLKTAKKILSTHFVEEDPAVTKGKRVTTPNKMRWIEIPDQNGIKRYGVLPKSYRSKEKIGPIFEAYGKAAAAEYMLHHLQKIYSASAKVADHHFEVVIRKVLSGATPRGILSIGLNTLGLLARLGFRRTAKVIEDSAARKEVDTLKGLKEKVIAGNILSL